MHAYFKYIHTLRRNILTYKHTLRRNILTYIYTLSINMHVFIQHQPENKLHPPPPPPPPLPLNPQWTRSHSVDTTNLNKRRDQKYQLNWIIIVTIVTIHCTQGGGGGGGGWAQWGEGGLVSTRFASCIYLIVDIIIWLSMNDDHINTIQCYLADGVVDLDPENERYFRGIETLSHSSERV